MQKAEKQAPGQDIPDFFPSMRSVSRSYHDWKSAFCCSAC